MGGLFRPQDETVMIAVEEQALKRHALMRHVYGVHFAGNGVRTRSIHPDISPAADQRGKRIRFDMKHERLRIDIGLRQGNLARSLQIRGGMPLFIRALRRIDLRVCLQTLFMKRGKSG